MWKPGSDKPQSVSTPTGSKRKKNNRKSGKTKPVQTPNGLSPSTTPSSSSNKKRLSGATLGMRFMKRKMDGIASSPGSVTSPQRVDTMSTPQSTPQSTSQQQQRTDSSSTTCIRQETASPLDMYGMRSALVGRRSFGGFHKSVSDTYEKVAAAQQKSSFRQGSTVLSDNELVGRYHDYVRGRGGGLEQVDANAAAPVGNLGAKVNKKKKGKRGSPSPSGSGNKRRR